MLSTTSNSNKALKLKKKLSLKKSFFLKGEKEILEEINKVENNMKRTFEYENYYSHKINKHKKIISKSMDKVNNKNNENEILLEDNNQNYSSINTNRKIINLNNYNTIINGIINLNSPLGKVYTKCVNNIKIGEKIIKNIDEEKSKSDEENKMKENKFKFHLRQLKDKALFDKLKKTEFDKKTEKKNE